MQAERDPGYRGEVPPEIEEMMREEVRYNEERMFRALEHPSVKEVKVRKKRKVRKKMAKASRRANR